MFPDAVFHCPKTDLNQRKKCSKCTYDTVVDLSHEERQQWIAGMEEYDTEQKQRKSSMFCSSSELEMTLTVLIEAGAAKKCTHSYLHDYIIVLFYFASPAQAPEETS